MCRPGHHVIFKVMWVGFLNLRYRIIANRHHSTVISIFRQGNEQPVLWLAPSLRGVELVDDPNIVPEGYSPELIWDGMNLIPWAVRCHYRSDHPESASADKSVEYMIDQHIPFIA